MDEIRSDRELLELAAKAAGLADARWDNFYGAISHTAQNGIKDCPWNPLTSDAEAFKLSVALSMNVYHEAPRHFAEYEDDANDMMVTMVEEEAAGIDAMLATRRVIVGAAAEIGSAK